MRVRTACLMLLAFVLLAAQPCLPLLASAPTEGLLPILEKHCLRCHGEDGSVEGEIDLRLFGSEAAVAQPKLLTRLLMVLRERRMPPEDETPLPLHQREQMIAGMEKMLEGAVARETFGPVPIRRMNRFQYNNAVVDLLELDRDIFQLNERLLRRRDDYFRPERGKMPDQVRVSSRPLSKDIDNQRPEGFRDVVPFPQDKRAEHGFDNRADHLTLSPLLMESFLQLSRAIVESPDLNPDECRSWNWLFAAPEGPTAQNHTHAIRPRLRKLLRRAFRRPVDSDTVERFAQFAEEQLVSGLSFEETMRTVVGAVLGMPEFLYISESVRDGDNSDSETSSQRLGDFALASRLAQFFWSSIPDDLLLDAAESGQLSEPATLSAQIDRMLKDRRMSRFCDNFASQWLQLDRLITSIPDPEKFPYFYYRGYRTSMHMMSEPLLLFDTVYLENRSIVDLLDPAFTWRSDMLQANYDGHHQAPTDVQVQLFKRIPMSDARGGGVITNAAVMTMTSTPTRTQPITRGAWINAVVFNDPPEPPPADVPPLPEADGEQLAKLTIRERLAAHRTRRDCAGCHNRIDPLGFALENFGPTGVWRDQYENGREVDVSGVLFNRYAFSSLVEFKRILRQERLRFIRGFVAHLLSYAMGRELGPADWPTLDEITSVAMQGDDRMQTVLKLIAMSEPFRRQAAPDG